MASLNLTNQQVDQEMCCNLPSSVSDYMKQGLCDKVGCDYDKCDWSDDGYKPKDPTPSPTIWEDDGYVCDDQARDICCNQSDKLSVNDKQKVCDKLGCMYKKCGWKRDGYNDDDSKPTWKNDGYNKDDDGKYDDNSSWKKDGYDDDKYDDDKYDDNKYDDNKYADKYDVDYNKVKDRYDEQWNYNGDEYKYSHVNDYDEDSCSAAEREACCTVKTDTLKQQWEMCETLGCNLKKVSTCYRK